MKLKVKKIADGWAVVDAEENDRRVYGPFSTQEAAESELKSNYSVNFAAWQTMSKDQRVKCVEDVGYPTGFAKQWANRDFTSLPADIKAGLLANGYFKQFVAEQNPVQFGGQYKYPNEDEVWAKINEAGRKIWLNKAGVSNNQTMHGYTHNWDWEKLPAATQNKLAEALSSIPPEHLGFAASDATKFGNAAENYADNRRREFQDVWENDASNEQVRKWLKQAGLGKQYAEMGWSSLPQEVINKLKSVMDLSNYEKSGHLFSARNFAAFETLTKLASDLLKSGAAESDVRNALKAQGCTDENQQREVLAAARSYETKEFSGADHHDDAMGFSANSDTMKPGGKFSAKFARSSAEVYADAEKWWASHSEEDRLAMARKANMSEGFGDKTEMSKKSWKSLSEGVRYEIREAMIVEGIVSFSSMGASLNGPGLKQDVVNAVLTNPARFGAAEPIRAGNRVGDDWERRGVAVSTKIENGKRMVEVQWEGRSSKEWVEEALLWRLGAGKGETSFAAEKPVLLGDVDKPKPTDSGQPGSEPLPPKPKYATTCPTDDEAKPEKKEFSTAVEAVNYLADHGYVNDRARAVARVDATGKWSAPSGASVERQFAAAEKGFGPLDFAPELKDKLVQKLGRLAELDVRDMGDGAIAKVAMALDDISHGKGTEFVRWANSKR